MKKSIGDYMIPKGWSFEQGLELIKKSGYDGVELWLGDVPWFQMKIKNVPGRNTDVKDAEWIAYLLLHGLLKASFVPPKPILELRDLTARTDELLRSSSPSITLEGTPRKAASKFKAGGRNGQNGSDRNGSDRDVSHCAGGRDSRRRDCHGEQ